MPPVGAVASAVGVNVVLTREFSVALFMAVIDFAVTACGAPLHEYVISSRSPGVALQLVPNAVAAGKL